MPIYQLIANKICNNKRNQNFYQDNKVTNQDLLQILFNFKGIWKIQKKKLMQRNKKYMI